MKKSNKCLLLITLSFPYYKGGENTFLQNEIEHLCRVFDKVTILPVNTEGEEQHLNSNPIIDKSLNSFLEKIKSSRLLVLESVFSQIFWHEIVQKPQVLFSINKIKKILGYIIVALSIKNWFSDYLLINKLTGENLTVYTYWCTSITHGIGLCRSGNNFKLVTRAHGIDLYEERGDVVCRSQLLKFIDGFYLVSMNGLDYMKRKYPKFADIFYLQPLGIKSSGFITSSSVNKFVIVSCSSLDRNKRVNLILDGLIRFALKQKSLNIYWHHFGEGILKKELEDKIKSITITNLHCILHGFVRNEFLMKFYRDNTIDLFITTTKSEGGRPVSMQEALSCGIPLMGTAVGGVPEIIEREVGILLNENPTAFEIEEKITCLIENPSEYKSMKTNALKLWNEKFNADNNYASFVNHLITNYR